MTPLQAEQTRLLSSAELATAIAAVDYSTCAATVVGYGTMGKQYVKALQALGVSRIRVCSRSAEPLEELKQEAGVESVAGGFEQLGCRPHADELGVIATPTALLITAVERLVSLGYRRLLIEKPISLWSCDIERLADTLSRRGVEAWCAYNRVAYPAFHEVRTRTAHEGGITSCAYTFTEMIKPDWLTRFSAEELARWGIGNSLHVIGMAHGLIGYPAIWHGHRTGHMSWHPTGAIFVGSGVTDRGIPFAYHADWGSTGRWSVEVHTPVSSYRLCPLEQVFRKTGPMAEWEAVPVRTFAPEVKAGIVEQVAAMLSPEICPMVPLMSLRTAAALTRYAEVLFGYAVNPSFAHEHSN